MKTGNKGLAIIKKYEGFSSKPYQDVVGIPTIGYGATYYPGTKKRVTMTDKPITQNQAAEMLVQHLINYEQEVTKLVKKPINQNQFDALVSFCYNLGAANLQKSTLLKKVNANPNDPSIRSEFARWVYAGGVKYNGLIRRRNEEADLYFT